MSKKSYENMELLTAIETVIENDNRRYIPEMIEELNKDDLRVCRMLDVEESRLTVEFDLYYEDDFVDFVRNEIAEKSLKSIGDDELDLDLAERLAESDNQYWADYYNPDQWVETWRLENELLQNLAKFLIDEKHLTQSTQHNIEHEQLVEEIRKITKFSYEYDYGGYFSPELYLDIAGVCERCKF